MRQRYFKRSNADFKKIGLRTQKQQRQGFPPALRIPHFPAFHVNWRVFKNTTIRLSSFILLLILYVSAKALAWISPKKYFPQVIRSKTAPLLSSFYHKTVPILEMRRVGTVSRVTLMELSIRNMQAKKTRTIITIGGMAVGIGAIVFLVSIGYGLQQLVISRVARLDEMKQVDVTIQPGSKVKINDKALSDIKQTSKVGMVLPLIAVVGRVNFQNSVSDMAVYGVTSNYLKQSAIQPVQGKIFDSNDLVVSLRSDVGEVAGLSTEAGKESIATPHEKIQNIEFSVTPGAWIRVRESPSAGAKILGYTKRTEGKQQGEELWGGAYSSDDGSGEAGVDKDGKKLGKWIKSPALLWEKRICETGSGDCENGSYVVARDQDNKQVQQSGYFAELNIALSGTSITQKKVLGVSTRQDGVLAATDSSDVDFVEIASEAGIIKPFETKQVSLGSNAKRQAIVNRAMLKVLGIKEIEAVGKLFSVSFVATGDLLDNPSEKIESTPAEYTIVGVTPDAKTPIFYVPFIDLRSIGIANYSQMKVVVDSQNDLVAARKQIEAMGYTTRSVADTVSQINSLFATARTILALLGMVALGVAALGMFNTLTVSLLERTREVGLMKAMGMKSSEVKELFLTESMIMGLFGGLLGLLLGFLSGKLVGLFLSIFSVFKGAGYIDISYIPPSFVVIILVLSLLVGLLTGIYPARRATKISALNALRYE